MIDRPNKTAKVRAEAMFRKVTDAVPAPDDDSETEMTGPADNEPASKSRPVETTEGAMYEYVARQQAERVKMAKLRELRLAAEAKTAVEMKAKRKPVAAKTKKI